MFLRVEEKCTWDLKTPSIHLHRRRDCVFEITRLALDDIEVSGPFASH